MDTYASILTAIHEILTGDYELEGIMGDVIVHPSWQPADTPMPYIVQLLDMRQGDPFPFRDGTLQLHLWSGSSNASEILSMRDRILALLDNLTFNTDEVSSCRLWLASDGLIPDEPGIWHFVCQFSLRLFKTAEMISILNRES